MKETEKAWRAYFDHPFQKIKHSELTPAQRAKLHELAETYHQAFLRAYP